jgi:hypothetical protein
LKDWYRRLNVNNKKHKDKIMARKAKNSVQGLKSAVALDNADFSINPTATNLTIVDKASKSVVVLPSEYMVALKKIASCVQSLAAPVTDDEAEENGFDENPTDETLASLEALV